MSEAFVGMHYGMLASHQSSVISRYHHSEYPIKNTHVQLSSRSLPLSPLYLYTIPLPLTFLSEELVRLLDVLSAWLEADPSPAHVMGGDTHWEGWAQASTPTNPHLAGHSFDRTRPNNNNNNNNNNDNQAGRVSSSSSSSSSSFSYHHHHHHHHSLTIIL